MNEYRSARVSYIITTRNRARFLESTLHNVREFITPDDELIVVDGGSTDETAEVAKKQADMITVFKSERDSGEAHGLNKGILESKGRYIKLLTDDDYFFPDAMHFAISIMDSHPELDAVQCGGEAFRMDPVTHESVIQFYEYFPPSLTHTGDVRNIFHHVPCGLGLVFRRRVIARVGLFDTTRFKGIDTEYLGRMAICGINIKYLNIKLFHHTEYPHSGQLIIKVSYQELIGSLLKSKDWSEMFHYPASIVGEVLGLNNLPGGQSLMKIIQHTERLRDSKLRFLLPFMAYVLEIGRWVFGEIRKILTFSASGKKGGAPNIQYPPIEPQWDGTLR
jgi:glycosyltransferase involved in cell wall biosynthesis